MGRNNGGPWVRNRKTFVTSENRTSFLQPVASYCTDSKPDSVNGLITKLETRVKRGTSAWVGNLEMCDIQAPRNEHSHVHGTEPAYCQQTDGRYMKSAEAQHAVL